VSRWMKACVLVALCIAVQPPVLATAATPGAASATASAQDVNPGYGCADTLVTYSVSLPPEATSWILGIRADSEDAISSWTYFDSASGDPLAGQGSMQVCSEGEREERTLTWKVDWTYVDQGDRIHTSDSGTGTTFVVNGVTAPSPFACPECDDTTTLGLRVVRKLDRVWVLKSRLVWRKGSDSARIAGASIFLVGPQGSAYKGDLELTNARGVARFRVKVPRRPLRLHTYFAGGKAQWGGTTIYLPRARSASLRVG
jgi:hypothetical protein